MSEIQAAPTFHPPTIPRPQDTIGRFSLIRGLLRNPLEMWTEYFFHNRAFTMKSGRRTFMQVMDPGLAKQILLTDADCFKKSFMQDRMLKPAVGEGLLTTEGGVWRQQRKAAAPAFRHDALARLVPTMQQAASDTSDRLAEAVRNTNEACRIDIHQEMIQATYDIIEETLLSGKSRDPHYPQKQIAEDIALYLETVGKFNLLDFLDSPDWVPRFLANPDIIKGNRAVERLRAFTQKQIEARQNDHDTGQDLLGLMIGAEDPETSLGLTDQQLLDNLITFIGAGHETTAVALSWTISILSHLPELQAQLFEEVSTIAGNDDIHAEHLPSLDLHERVLLETMRLYPPVCIIPRSVLKPVTVAGNHLDEGDHVAIAVYPMHRHAYLWDNPNAFDPGRFTEDKVKTRDRFQYLPFGAGPRICIGMKFAMMEAITILATLTRQFRFQRDESHVIIPQMAVTLRPKGGMPVFVELR